MPTDPIQEFFERIAKEGRELGALVRCEAYGVIAMVHPKHATEAEKQPVLPIGTEANLCQSQT